MAHKRKDTYVTATERWDHLRPGNKRLQNRKERINAVKRIKKELEEWPT